MVRIRMQRLGRTHRPFFRITAIDQRTRRNGRCIEQLGWYNPLEKEPEKQLHLNEERIKYWLSVGAQPSDTVRDILARRSFIKTTEWEAKRAADRNRVAAAKSAATGDAAKTE